MSKSKTAAAVALLAFAALALAACGGAGSTGGSGEPTAEGGAAAKEEGKPTTIMVRNGEPLGGVQKLEYSAGEEIRFKVESDVSDEIHVHGYDLMQDVKAGGSVSFEFPAEIEGIFEVELEERKEQIAEIRVNP